MTRIGFARGGPIITSPQRKQGSITSPQRKQGSITSPQRKQGLILAALLCCLAAVGCKSRAGDSDSGKLPDAWIVYPVYRDVVEFEDFTGKTEPENSIVVKARATGHLTKVNFKDGDMVRGPIFSPPLPLTAASTLGLSGAPMGDGLYQAFAVYRTLTPAGKKLQEGDVLFEIDHREYQAAVDKATAHLAQTRAQLEQIIAQRDQSRAQLQQYTVRTETLEKDHARGLPLLESKAMAREVFDKIDGDLKEARALVRLAEASINAAEANIKTAEANIKTAEADKQTAEYNLAWCWVTADISGRISRRALDPFNVIEKEKTVLSNIVSLDPMYATFDIDERTVLRLQKNVKAGKQLLSQEHQLGFKIGLADETGYSIDGVLDFVDNKIDTGTGTLRIRGTFDNTMFVAGTWPWERPTNYRLPPGLFIRIRLPVGDPRQRLLIPEKAIQTDQDKKFIYVIKGNKEVEYRTVKLGVLLEDQMRVIESGLNLEEMVVSKGHQRIRPKLPDGSAMVVEPRVDPQWKR